MGDLINQSTFIAYEDLVQGEPVSVKPDGSLYKANDKPFFGVVRTDAKAGEPVRVFEGKICYCKLGASVSAGANLDYKDGAFHTAAATSGDVHTSIVAVEDGVSGDVIKCFVGEYSSINS